jgi:hypothetical protein
MGSVKNMLIEEQDKLIKLKIKINENARNNYRKRKDEGTNKQLKHVDDYLKRGPKLKDKLIIVKNPVGRPTKKFIEYYDN